MRVIVCGGRDFDNQQLVNETLDRIHAERPIKHLWHGNARGADTCAHYWCYRPGKNKPVPCHAVPADWKKHGKAAGPKRNQAMLGQGIDLVVAFPGGRGTADMVRRAKKAGVEVIEIQTEREAGNG